MSEPNALHSMVDILIVGAGPTGLALATALARFGLDFKIIDKNSVRSDKSKAIGVQAGTLEAIENVFGHALANQFVTSGAKASQAFLHINDQAPVSVGLSQIPSKYNFLLILEQSETERIFEKLLNQSAVYVYREQTLISAKNTEDGVDCVIQRHDGTLENVKARYVVGCDGAHSAVRESIAIPFEGGSYSGDFVLGDVHVEWPWEHNKVRAFLSDRGALACFPMKGHHKYRFIIVESNAVPPSSAEITFEEFKKIANQFAPEPIEISAPVWMTRFRVHHRIASHFKSGRIFLAGDAAHIHSPAGGQGMNTGIQDSFNLASKFRAVLAGGADEFLLDEYEFQRFPVANDIVRTTDFIFRQGILLRNPLLTSFRNWLMPKIIGIKKLQNYAMTAMSEVEIARKEIEIRNNEARWDRPSDVPWKKAKIDSPHLSSEIFQ